MFNMKTQPDIQIEPWKHSRHWAIFLNGKLLAVTVYKKGALALRDHILEWGVEG